ncbi:MAG: type II secretion system F family protein [Candidatus Aminicenantes bacterium]
MPHFFCKLASEDGHTLRQSFFAPSSQECRAHFEAEGFCVLSIKRDWKRISLPSFPSQKKIKDKDFIMFNQEFVALIRAGYPILKSIEIIVSRIKNVHLKEILMKVENEIRAGKSLSEAFSSYEKNISKVYLAALMAGERSGNLASTISRYIDYAQVISKTKSRIRSALSYPTLLLVFSFFLVALLINFILPRFSEFYADFEAQLPGITRWLMSFSLAVRNNIFLLSGLIFLLILVYIQMRKREKALVIMDQFKLRVPYGGVIWLESGISLFCRTLSLLLSGGISLLQSVEIARHALPNKFLVRKLAGLPGHIKNGESLSNSLAKSGFFPLLALDMIRIGEASANLEGMLAEVADVYDERIKAKINTFVSLVEPLIIIFMGMMVAAMLLSIYLPIFNIIRVAR